MSGREWVWGDGMFTDYCSVYFGAFMGGGILWHGRFIREVMGQVLY